MLDEIADQFSRYLTNPWIIINSASQSLFLVKCGLIDLCYPVSTSKYGLGSAQDSYKTPLGAHIIAEKIGSHCAINEILRARQPTGNYADIIQQPITSSEDLVLTRILWLQGIEKGSNAGKGVDSYQRYIYIHGTPEEGLIGTPASHGCIRMNNADVIDLFARVHVSTFVYIC